MTEEEAKKLLMAKLEKMIDADCPLAWVGEVVCETSAAFIIEGSFYAKGENPQDSASFCAVDKKTGKSGVILPPPGIRLTPEIFRNFRWDDWQIV